MLQKLKYGSSEGTTFVLANMLGDDPGDFYEAFQSIFTWRDQDNSDPMTNPITRTHQSGLQIASTFAV